MGRQGHGAPSHRAVVILRGGGSSPPPVSPDQILLGLAPSLPVFRIRSAGVRACPAVGQVVASNSVPGIQGVATVLPEEPVVTALSADGILSTPGADHVVAATAEDLVGAGQGQDGVAPAAAAQGIPSDSADDVHYSVLASDQFVGAHVAVGAGNPALVRGFASLGARFCFAGGIDRGTSG